MTRKRTTFSTAKRTCRQLPRGGESGFASMLVERLSSESFPDKKLLPATIIQGRKNCQISPLKIQGVAVSENEQFDHPGSFARSSKELVLLNTRHLEAH